MNWSFLPMEGSSPHSTPCLLAAKPAVVPHTVWLANILVRLLSNQCLAGPGAEKGGEVSEGGDRGMLGLRQVIDVPCAGEQGIKWEKM